MQVGPGCMAKEGSIGVRTSGFHTTCGHGAGNFRGLTIIFLLRRLFAETHEDYFSQILKWFWVTHKRIFLLFSVGGHFWVFLALQLELLSEESAIKLSS